MRLARAALLLLALCLSACAVEPPVSDEAQIRNLLDAQAEAWNRGDIDAFMRGYWNSEELRFASGDSVTYGWAAASKRYHERYPDRAAMGRLEFSQMEVEMTGPDAALVFGHWTLRREHDRPQGLFSLLLRRTADGWKITRDHTSAGP